MREEAAGYVFVCSDATQDECLERSLFGGKDAYLPRVKDLKKGDTVFLYNYNAKKFHGPFIATSTVQPNIVASAWGGFYPQQVRVRRVILEDPLSREDVAGIIKFDRAGRPTPRLTKTTVDTLIDLFKGTKRAKTYRDDIQHRCIDGHMVRSKAELAIDDWLFENRIVHAYETPVGSDRCDFMIPTEGGSVYIEYWGLKTPDYLKNMERKMVEYESLGFELISLYPEDLKDLSVKLGKFLPQ